MKREKGFTLIETIFVIVLIGIIAGFVGGLLFQETRMYGTIQPRKEQNTETSLVLDRILKDLRFAYRNEFTTGSNVKFKIPYRSFNDYSVVNVFLSGNKLYLKTDNKDAKILAENVIYFNITSIRANYINYTSRLYTRNLIKLKITTQKQDQTVSNETVIFLRNSR